MFRELVASRGDRLDDLFPGSRAVTHAWKRLIASIATARLLVDDVSLLPAETTRRVPPAPDDVSPLEPT
jgi:hypothetical protein